MSAPDSTPADAGLPEKAGDGSPSCRKRKAPPDGEEVRSSDGVAPEAAGAAPASLDAATKTPAAPPPGKRAAARAARAHQKEQPCFAWLKGDCARENCKFKHDESQKGSQPDGVQTSTTGAATSSSAAAAAGGGGSDGPGGRHPRDLADPLAVSGPLARVLDKGFSKWYFVAGEDASAALDQYVYVHGNGMMHIGLAPTHKLLGGRTTATISKVAFSASAAGAEVHGKRNKGGLKVVPKTQLATVTLSDGEELRVLAAVEAQLVEVNDRLLEEPRLLQMDAEGVGHIATLQLKKPSDLSRILATLTDEVGLAEKRGPEQVAAGKPPAPRWAPQARAL
eukprot:TRINITY_DN69182_c0_g1_i1.p2 TRINITY_DN69182_c0_g1~~TRINITY_DN69182_c0_g1_i1.p2  ORF type:complete len:337 (-),score=104.00 TRINITY_DN69182_c0_g1_i1:26-1036(-)